MKQRCKICRQPATRRRGLVSLCDAIECEVELGLKLLAKGKVEKRKEEVKRDRARKDALKSRSDWLREVQVEFNRMIRFRDLVAGHHCISCDTSNHKVKLNAGHFLSVGAHPELRFEESNVHLQCEKCNSYLSGNISAYRPRLIQRIGQDKVDWLEGPHEPQKWSIEELKAMKATYRARANEYQKQLNERGSHG